MTRSQGNSVRLMEARVLSMKLYWGVPSWYLMYCIMAMILVDGRSTV